MNITNQNFITIKPIYNNLNKTTTKKLFLKIKKYSSFRIGLDLSDVSDCTEDFIKYLLTYSQKQNIGIFNISSDIFALLISLNMDKFVKIFVNQDDFINNNNQLVNRNFRIV